VASSTHRRNGVALLLTTLAALVALLALAGSSGAMTSSSGADPWIASDLADYAPGSTVHLTGGNWQPGEEVRILTNDTVGNTWSQSDTVTADVSGAIADDVVLPSYFISDYTVTATAASGSATTTFTDAVNYQFLGKDALAHTSAGSEEDLGSVTSGSTVSATCSAGLTAKATGLGGGQSTTYAISYVSGYGDNATLSSPGSRTQVNPASGTFVGNGSTCTSLSVSTTGLAAGTYHGELQMRNTGGATATTDVYFFRFTVAPTQQATSISSVSGSGTYGGTASLTATLKAGTTPLSGKSISFTINGSAAGTATTDASGVATLSGASLSGINAGTGTVGASFAGDSGFLGSSGSGSLTVAKASSTTVVSCPASVTYDGSAKTPCSASATGAGGLNQALTVTYSDNTAAGTATASASYGGDANHNGSSDSKTFTIATASSTTTVSCPGTSITYDGSAKTPCTATVTGAGGLNQTLTVGYSNNTDAGTATASAVYAGDANHGGSSDSKTFTIAKASSTTTVNCPASVTYDGSAKTPCSANVTGIGGLNQPVAVDYSNNTGAGTATASATFGGDSNHDGSSGSDTFSIDEAPSTVTVSCPDSRSYTGSALEPCSAKANGAGGLDADLSVSYSDNVNAGTATASASYGGDSNHDGSGGSDTFTIEKTASTVTVSCPDSRMYTGSALEPCSAKATGAGGLDADLTVSYSDNTNAGTATASASYGGDANHEGDNGSATFTIEKAPSAVAVTCPDSRTYTGSAIEPCTAKATGAGGLDHNLTVSYSDNVNAGTATASATYGGDGNHTGSSGSNTFTIDKASSTVTVTCPGSRTYTGGAIEPCSAKANGAGGLNEDLGVSYSDNVDAGTATASATYGGDANHHGSSASNTFTIDKAPSNVTVSCAAGPFTYDGSPQTPCSANVTGAGGLNVTLTVSYADNVNAGTATASAAYGGDANHEGDSDSETFAIAKAPSTVAVSCSAGPFVYSGSPHTPCSANVTGAGGLDQSLPVSYSDNVGAGTATASASYAGDANHLGDSASKTFTIDKAPAHVAVTCPDSRTYTGSAIEPCTARATGAGGLDAAIAVSYASNVDAGTAMASATYGGDPNHLGDSGSSTFTIAKAPSTVAVSCAAGPFTYNGSAQTPCSAKATGAGGLDVSLTVSYSDNVNAGPATASASYGGDANHLGDSSSKTFTIGKATPTVSVNWAAWTFDGTAHPASGSVTGVGGAALGTPSFTYYSGTGTSGTPLAGAPSGVGTYTVLAGFAGNSNYTAASKTKTVGVLYRWDGFLQPINDTAHQGGFESFFKLGSTVPAKFQLKKADGTVVQAGTLPTFSRSTAPVSCDTQIAPELLDSDVGFTGSTFRWDSGQYIYNWSTKGLKAGEYRIYATLDDGSKQYVDICLQ
jgi:hypothetical protein